MIFHKKLFMVPREILLLNCNIYQFQFKDILRVQEQSNTRGYKGNSYFWHHFSHVLWYHRNKHKNKYFCITNTFQNHKLDKNGCEIHRKQFWNLCHCIFNLRLSQKSPSNGTNLQSQSVPLSTEMHIPPFSQGFRFAQ